MAGESGSGSNAPPPRLTPAETQMAALEDLLGLAEQLADRLDLVIRGSL